jgi:alanyl-tRNA synthetase
VGDVGWATTAGGARVRVEDAIKPAGETIVHLGVVEAGAVAIGDALTLEVDEDRRDQVRANHSATHLLNLALREVLGEHVAQKGSLVAPERLRFDFAHARPVTPAQLREIEDRVNRWIRANDDSQTEVLGIAEARERGAVAMFGEKYGERVRVVRIGHASLEFCGGTHVRRAGDIGVFKIVSESGIAQGVRRIEAVTGAGALAHVRRLEDELARASAQLRVPPLEVAGRVDRLLTDARALDRELAQLKAKLAAGGARDLGGEIREVNGVRHLVTRTEVDDVRALRETGDNLKAKLGSGVLVLAGVGADKVSVLTMVTDDLTDRFHAGKLCQAVASVLGGKGGGRADMAQGGGKDPSRVPEALAAAVAAIERAANAGG